MNFTRKDWKARPPRARYRMDPADVEGVALHWPAMGTTKLNTPPAVMGALRSWQDYHMDSQGWSDIAYQIAVDQDGNWYQLRGLRHRSGANGDDDVNRRFGAFLLVVGEREAPSAAMIATVRARIARFQHIYTGANKILGHMDVRPDPTACPGPAVEKLILEGKLTPNRR